jgi:hypothetical protein
VIPRSSPRRAPHRASRTQARLAWTLALLVGALALLPARARAQRPDTTRRAAVPIPRAGVAVRRDTSPPAPEATPPLSPRRAFAYSLLAPGSAQTVLGRPNAAAIFILAEVASIAMIGESSANVREARRLARDSVFLGVDPVSGQRVLGPPPYPLSLVRSRQTQVEDWIAVLVANHLFAAADGFVAAHLWDVPASVSASATPGRLSLRAMLRW